MSASLPQRPWNRRFSHSIDYRDWKESDTDGDDLFFFKYGGDDVSGRR